MASAPVAADPESPLVDDFFWLRRAGDLVTGGSELRTEAARQLMSALTWLWTVYTGAAVISAARSHADAHPLQAIVLAFPSVTLVVAYMAAVFAFMPVTVEFDPRDPEEVRVSYATALHRGFTRLKLALTLTAASALAIAGAIIAVTTLG